MKLSKTSIALLVIQLALVSSIAAKYLYQRHSLPRVWTRAAAFDPSLPMRGRYLSVQLLVDGCASTLPSAKLAAFPHNSDGTVKYGSVFTVHGRQTVNFLARLQVKNGRLIAVQPDGVETMEGAQRVTAHEQAPCSEMVLDQPVDYYIAEHAQSPLPTLPGQELWMEVTVPTNGPPRPLQLAIKSGNEWRPLDLR
jgi:hypothetical protein